MFNERRSRKRGQGGQGLRLPIDRECMCVCVCRVGIGEDCWLLIVDRGGVVVSLPGPPIPISLLHHSQRLEKKPAENA
jgi:hypothetical protein